jgi:hypothetical protein
MLPSVARIHHAAEIHAAEHHAAEHHAAEHHHPPPPLLQNPRLQLTQFALFMKPTNASNAMLAFTRSETHANRISALAKVAQL